MPEIGYTNLLDERRRDEKYSKIDLSRSNLLEKEQ